METKRASSLTSQQRSRGALGSKGLMCILTIIEDLSFWSSEFLSCNAAHSVCCYLLAFFTSPCGYWQSEGHGKNAGTLTTATARSEKLWFFSDPRVLCLQPASTKLCQANLLAYKSCKNPRTFTVLKNLYSLTGCSQNQREVWGRK